MTDSRKANLSAKITLTSFYFAFAIFELPSDGSIKKSPTSTPYGLEELVALNRSVTMYLDYAEDQALSRKPLHMADWVKKLDGFLQFNEKNILTHAGKISQKMALDHAEKEFKKFETNRRQIETKNSASDFDKMAKQITSKKPKKK